MIMDIIGEVIEKSWYKFNPKLTQACLALIKSMNETPPPDRKCWRFQQMLFLINKAMPMNLPHYWYKEGVVVDPEMLMLVTGGIIRFKWEDDCLGCQIEKECPCKGNPNNNNYVSIEEKLKSLRDYRDRIYPILNEEASVMYCIICGKEIYSVGVKG